MFRSYILTAVFSCLALIPLLAQEISEDTTKTKPNSLLQTTKPKYPANIIVDVSYGAHLVQGDLKDRFSHFLNVGAKVHYMTAKGWTFSISSDYLFAETINADMLSSLREENGYIIDRQGALTVVKQQMRGFMLQGGIGKFIPFVADKKKRFGVDIRLQAGYLQHWVRFKFGGEELVQLMGDYRKGYDRKTSGLMTQQYIGLRYMSTNRRYNFFAGLEFSEGFTKNRRYWNYDEMRADSDLKIDLFTGFRIGVSIPFPIYNYKKQTLEDVILY